MEGLSVSKVFGVPEDYTLEQLKQSYLNLMENLFKSDKTQVEKDLLASQYKNFYHYGKQMYLERVSIDTDDEHISFPYHSSYSSNSNELYLFDRFDRMFNNSFGFGQRIKRNYNPFSMYDNVFNQLNKNNQSLNSNSNSHVYSYSSSYSSNTNPDGSITIIEKKSESTNGDKKKTINAYKKMPDGSIVNLSEDEMKQLEKMSNLKIKN
jgi:hypothetical protein